MITYLRFINNLIINILYPEHKDREDTMSNKLVAFYSRADENYFGGALKYIKIGNTELAASIIQELTDADSFKIEQQKQYSKAYNDCIAEAQEDQRRDARPELKSCPTNLDGYDTIYLGYPNYWGTMPMAVFTFLEKYDLSGVTIKPFCTHEGSGMGKSEKDIQRLCPGAKVEKGLAIIGCQVENSKKDIEKWI